MSVIDRRYSCRSCGATFLVPIDRFAPITCEHCGDYNVIEDGTKLHDPESIDAKACEFAKQAHQPQLYRPGVPYIRHVESAVVAAALAGVVDPEILAAIWLHDTVEDAGVKISAIREMFGERIADLVWAVTGRILIQDGWSACIEGNRKTTWERLIAPRLVATPGAITVKLADRVANVQACWATRDPRLFMYRAEHAWFTGLLSSRMELFTVQDQRLWKLLKQMFGYEKG